MTNRSNRVAVAGVGFSEVGRRLPHPDDELVRQAITAAMADGGMAPADIDGIATMGGNAMAMGQLLGIVPLDYFYSSTLLGPAFVEPAIMAISAVASGLCHTCVAVRLIRQFGGANRPPEPERARGPMRVAGDNQFSAPFGAGAAGATIGGFQMQRHMHQYGTTYEQFAANAVTARSHAALHPEAIFRDPLTVDDYLASRFVSEPLRLLDCDYPVDSAAAVIFTTPERAADRPHKPVLVEAYALSAIRDFDMSLIEDFTWNAPAHCAEALWSRTDLSPSDVDTAQLYDGFSVITFQWLEALGFCGRGEAGPFIAEGNTRLGGRLPLNTDGGACNFGRRHGANFCIEAVRQLRGEAGARQVPGAEVAVWTNAVGCFAGAVLLTAG
ncbi:MAG TPA: thiolase family protein [Acidimicrobiales bacterium]|nr:thiolase family protein [Acidimicrobiales bacterium]